MVKLSGSISRKVPIEGIQYSSQSFAAGMEVEVSDGEDPNVIRERIRQLYTLLSQSIDEQIAGAQVAPQSNGNGAPPPQSRLPAPPLASRSQQPTGTRTGYATGRARSTNGNGGNGGNGRKTNGAPTPCTEAQRKCIFAVAKSLGLTVEDVLADYNYGALEQVSVKAASQMIDDLKSRQNGSPTQQ